MIIHCCRIVNGTKNKNIKNSLGATWNASHLAVRLCALRHWKRVPMPPTTQSLRHPLTRAFHIAPMIKTARLRRKTKPGRDVILHVRHNCSIILNINNLSRTRNIASLPCEIVLGDLTQLLKSFFSSGVFRRETASGFYPWGKMDSPRKRVAE